MNQALDQLRKEKQNQNHDTATVFLYLVSIFKVTGVPRKNPLSFTTLTDRDLTQMCRFNSHDLLEVSQKLLLPEQFTTRHRYRFGREEGLFILCCRLAFPHTISSLSRLLGYSKSALVDCFAWMVYWLFEKWGFLLEDFKSGQLHTDDWHTLQQK
ncbi:hypothetical protein EDC01DRAFT_633273 [Geopyxis carbonaria]|nr:hypothetical protein EDC01DRAFT_633273 [Geopyxis carbonaria]